jgi:hypothetical protein
MLDFSIKLMYDMHGSPGPFLTYRGSLLTLHGSASLMCMHLEAMNILMSLHVDHMSHHRSHSR